jgi:Spy/CpxP family protein refolding chaperone
MATISDTLKRAFLTTWAFNEGIPTPGRNRRKSMKTFKKFAATLAIAAASLSIAGAAQAQPGYGPNHGQHQAIQQGWNLTPVRSAQIRQDIASLNRAIDRAAARRTISPREAAGLRQQARDVQRLYGQ